MVFSTKKFHPVNLNLISSLPFVNGVHTKLNLYDIEGIKLGSNQVAEVSLKSGEKVCFHL